MLEAEQECGGAGFDHPCRVQYRVVLGEGDRRVDSGVLDQISDLSGRIRGFSLGAAGPADLVRRGTLRLQLHMLSANAISEAKVRSRCKSFCVLVSNFARILPVLVFTLHSEVTMYMLHFKNIFAICDAYDTGLQVSHINRTI